MGRRILVVEDVLLIAELLVDQLVAWGFEVVGPAGRLAQALQLAAARPLDCALLDVNLAGEYCFPVADALRARGIPFLFVTGYDEDIIPLGYRFVPRLQKPLEVAQLARMIAAQLA
jgi:CheY-like chemotaxis protein